VVATFDPADMVDALDSMFRSAAAGYVVVGSDIGGYLDRDDDDLMVRIPFDLEVFARWTATACFTPFFQLHGRANLTPWTVPERAEEFTALYRYYATLHHELAPYYYDLAEEAYAGGPTILRAVAGPEAWKTDPRFLVGAAFLVAPPVSAGRSLSVELPSGGRYLDWWNLDGPWLDPQRLEVATPLDRIPIFVREGAIIPLATSSTVSGLVDSADAGFTVFVAPGPTTSRFVHYEDDDTRTGSEAETGAGAATVRIARVTKATRLVVRQEVASAVTLNGAALGHERWGQNGARVWVMLEPSENPVTIEIH
jgi:alpha-D-xyloside xylohydrolase